MALSTRLSVWDYVLQKLQTSAWPALFWIEGLNLCRLL